MRRVFHLDSTQFHDIKNQLLEQSATSEYFQFFDSNQHDDKYSDYDWLCALGAEEVFEPHEKEFEKLQLFYNERRDWLFGHFSYDLKNKLEKLGSATADRFEFPLLSFFVPSTVVYQVGSIITVESFVFENAQAFVNTLDQNFYTRESHSKELIAQTSKDEYLRKIEDLKRHLQFGNIYEINFCLEFANYFKCDPLKIFKQLQELSQAPFAAYYKYQDQYLICASPERYLKKIGDKIISQPIKGTAKRSHDLVEDLKLKEQLLKDEKERAENVMIVDLVRNDLSHTSRKGSVKVEELFGIYSYQGVHQMMSTIESEIDPTKTSFTDVIKYSFPMGSMTGAPKIKAMKLIEEFESFTRSLYSGSVGYISPDGDFDFNVVIRSILYNAKTNYVSARVGSAITIHCDAEKEYEECLLKAQNLFKTLSQSLVEV